MQKKLSFILLSILFIALIGCSKNEEPSEAKVDDQNLVEEKNEPEIIEEEEEKEEEEPVEENAPVVSQGEIDFNPLIKEMEERTDGTASLIYENLTEQSMEITGLNITLDAYQYVALDDFHTNYQIPFRDNTDGAVLLAHYTIENPADETAYYMPDFSVSYPGIDYPTTNYRDLIPLEVQIHTKLSPTSETEYEIPAKSSISGYTIVPLSPQMMKDIEELGEVEINVSVASGPYDEEAGYNKRLPGRDKIFNVSLSEEGATKIAERNQFYKDDLTYKNMGTKTLVKEEEGINHTEKLSNSNITLVGFQFTEFTPNEVEARRFSNFDTGIIALTVKFEIENKESEPIDLDMIDSSRLDFNNGKYWTLNEGMLLMEANKEILEPGQKGEFLQIFILDKKEYDLLFKDESFEVEVGPLRSPDFDDLSKGKRVKFKLQ